VTFSASRAPGIAGTFAEATAAGAPMVLTRVGSRASWSNRSAALQGQQRPAGMSLDEYPFASSERGGAGATLRGVPVAEQNYQGGVLSQFYQSNGVKPGDSFRVAFGE